MRGVIKAPSVGGYIAYAPMRHNHAALLKASSPRHRGEHYCAAVLEYAETAQPTGGEVHFHDDVGVKLISWQCHRPASDSF